MIATFFIFRNQEVCHFRIRHPKICHFKIRYFKIHQFKISNLKIRHLKTHHFKNTPFTQQKEVSRCFTMNLWQKRGLLTFFIYKLHVQQRQYWGVTQWSVDMISVCTVLSTCFIFPQYTNASKQPHPRTVVHSLRRMVLWERNVFWLGVYRVCMFKNVVSGSEAVVRRSELFACYICQ